MSSAKNLSLAGLFAALTAAGAFLRIPLPGAPITLQFFFTLMAGFLLGPKWGTISQGLYLCLGLLGLPVFSLGGGLSYILQPSFGFVLGMIPAAAMAGWLREHPTVACLAAWVALYTTGLPYLHLLTAPAPFWDTIKTGFLLFLPGDSVKIFAAALLFSKLRKVLPITD